MSADHRAGRFAKDFRATAGTRIQSGLDQLRDHVFVTQLVEMRKVIEFDHRKCFEMELWVVLLQFGEQIGEIAERKFCVESTGNVNLSGAFLNCLAGDTQTIFYVMRVSIRLAWRSIEAAKLAIGVANISGVQVAVHIEDRWFVRAFAGERCRPIYPAPANRQWQTKPGRLQKTSRSPVSTFSATAVKYSIVGKIHEIVLRRAAPPNVTNRITLTKALVVKNAAFNLLKSSAFTSRCW